MARSLFFIRHKPTGQWYVSSRGFYFSRDFNDASVFHQRANAEKQIRSMCAIHKNKSTYHLSLEDVDHRKYPITVDTHIDLEVVEFELVQKV